MSSTKPFVVRWGIIGAGGISGSFVSDLCLQRDVDDVSHAVTAVASRDVGKAQSFIDTHAPRGACAQQAGLVSELPAAVGSYEALVTRHDVDCVYVGTPHSQHFDHAKLAIEAGKNVLLEKPATLNAAEWTDLVRLAKKHDVFLMEAVWTRFFPIAYKWQDLLFNDKVIGDVTTLFADLALPVFGNLPDTHRMFAPELAGGAQLDLGPYPLVWALMSLFQHPKNARSPPSRVAGSMMPHPSTGVDIVSTLTLDFDKLPARANLTCSTIMATPSDVCVRIVGSKGELVIPKTTFKPEAIVVRRTVAKDERGFPIFEEERIDAPSMPGMGLFWEADAVARSLRDGEKENKRMPHDETLLEMQLMDQWREQSGYKFPDGLEKLR